MTETTNQPPEICPEPKCGGKIVKKEGTSKKTNKHYSFYGCSNYPKCHFIYHPPKSTPKPAGGEENDQGETIIRKLNQVLYLMTGVHPEEHKDEFDEMMKNEFGRGLLRRVVVEKKVIPVIPEKEEELL